MIAPAKAPLCAYVPALDGLRALAIGLVFLFHAGTPGLPGANIGVDIFFVLSGYLIGRLLLAEYAASRQIDLKRFYSRRLWRLTPPLLLLLGLYALLARILWPDYFFHLRDGAEVLLYLVDIALILGDGPEYLTHAWSLSIEERFYLLLPLLLVGLLSQVSRRWLWLAPLLLALLVTLWRWYWALPTNYVDGLYYRFDVRISGLTLGVAVACLPSKLIPDCHRFRGRSLLLMGTLLLLIVVPDHGQAWRLAYGLPLVELISALAIIWVVQQPNCLLASVLSTPGFAYIGKISYGLYLFHYPVMQYLQSHFQWAAVLLIATVITLIMAMLSWHLIEAPLSRYKKR